jgi:hypothetical protein
MTETVVDPIFHFMIDSSQRAAVAGAITNVFWFIDCFNPEDGSDIFL